MMEEVSDDTNGESSFEFVSGKIEETSVKDENTSITSTQFYASPLSVQTDVSKFPISPPLAVPPSFPASVQKTDPNISNITFYNPQDTKTVMFPPPIPDVGSSPLITNVPSVSPNQYPPMQQSYTSVTPPSAPLQTYQGPPSQEPYYSSSVPHSLSLPVPLDQPDTLQPGVLPQGSTESGVWGWLKGKDFLNKVAEKAKSSVDSVITTLDPGMKEIINSGGDINVVVASGNEDKISAIREAFQCVFGKATVQGIPVQSSSIAPQPVGFSAGLKAAEERISNLKQILAQNRPILVAIENFLAEITPDKWFDIGCLLLQDQSSGISLQIYTEAIPVSSHYVEQAKSQTPADYPLGWSGYAVTIGQIMENALGCHHSHWHQTLTGVSRREILFLASKTIAGLYKSQSRR